jgi:UPF0176 protein
MQNINIAGYKFIPLNALSELRTALLEVCTDLGFKGTILLSVEGINITVAGIPTQVECFKAYLKNDARFEDMTFRESYSVAQPFKRMKVKIKQEIITMHRPEVCPETLPRAPHISPAVLKQWLDEKRDITVLDTRNDYEVKLGTFATAESLGINDFGDFPQAAKKLNPTKPIVMFCTGGIRCEKAALHLLDQGFSDVYQLDGGILNYFATVGGAHYQGDCFVFDERVAVDINLQESQVI